MKFIETEIAGVTIDPQIGVVWPVAEPILSAKDREASLAEQMKQLPVRSAVK
jgi:hypothetical protein